MCVTSESVCACCILQTCNTQCRRLWQPPMKGESTWTMVKLCPASTSAKSKRHLPNSSVRTCMSWCMCIYYVHLYRATCSTSHTLSPACICQSSAGGTPRLREGTHSRSCSAHTTCLHTDQHTPAVAPVEAKRAVGGEPRMSLWRRCTGPPTARLA